MFFRSKKKEEKKELLYRENIRTGCAPASQEDVIRQVGQMLVDSGYVDQPYVDAMLEREKTFSTFMGNLLALPHGVEAAKKRYQSIWYCSHDISGRNRLGWKYRQDSNRNCRRRRGASPDPVCDCR